MTYRVLEIGFSDTTRYQQKMSLFLKFKPGFSSIFVKVFENMLSKNLKMGEKNKIENYVERVFTYRKEGPGPHSERLKGLTTLHASVDRQKLSLSHSSHIFTLPKLLYISGQASTYFGINFFHQILWEKVDSNVIFE